MLSSKQPAFARILLLHGDKDMRFPVSVAERLKVSVPHVRKTIIADAGHMTHIEKTNEWNQAVSAFLNQLT